MILFLLPKMSDTVLEPFAAGGAAEILLAGAHPVVESPEGHWRAGRVLIVQILGHHLKQEHKNQDVVA